MGKIVISQNISLDGVVEDPTGEEGFQRGGWFERFLGEDRAAWADAELAEVLDAEALLLGRRSDAYFGTRWTSRTGDWADRLNAMPKYVVSATLTDPVWANSTVLKGDAVEEVTHLRQSRSGDVIVYGSRRLARTLLANDLVDELRLIVFPVVLGAGERLCGDTPGELPLRRLETTALGAGLTHLRYEVLA